MEKVKWAGIDVDVVGSVDSESGEIEFDEEDYLEKLKPEERAKYI